MRNTSIFLAVLFCCSFVFSGCDQSTNEEAVLPTEKPDTVLKHVKVTRIVHTIDTLDYLKKIDHYVDELNNTSVELKLTKQDVFGKSAEGGEVIVYTKNIYTVKIKAVYYGETGKSEYDIYLRDGNIVRFDKKLSYYNGPIGKNPAKIDSVIQSTFTIYKKQIIAGKDAKNELPKEEYAEKLLNISNIYKEIVSDL